MESRNSSEPINIDASPGLPFALLKRIMSPAIAFWYAQFYSVVLLSLKGQHNIGSSSVCQTNRDNNLAIFAPFQCCPVEKIFPDRQRLVSLPALKDGEKKKKNQTSSTSAFELFPLFPLASFITSDLYASSKATIALGISFTFREDVLCQVPFLSLYFLSSVTA